MKDMLLTIQILTIQILTIHSDTFAGCLAAVGFAAYIRFCAKKILSARAQARREQQEQFDVYAPRRATPLLSLPFPLISPPSTTYLLR